MHPASDTLYSHPPGWGWLVTCYFFLGGLAGGSYFIAALAEIVGGRAARKEVRAGVEDRRPRRGRARREVQNSPERYKACAARSSSSKSGTSAVS